MKFINESKILEEFALLLLYFCFFQNFSIECDAFTAVFRYLVIKVLCKTAFHCLNSLRNCPYCNLCDQRAVNDSIRKIYSIYLARWINNRCKQHAKKYHNAAGTAVADDANKTKNKKSWMRSTQIDMYHNKSFTLNFKFVKLKSQIISKISKFTMK